MKQSFAAFLSMILLGLFGCTSQKSDSTINIKTGDEVASTGSDQENLVKSYNVDVDFDGLHLKGDLSEVEQVQLSLDGTLHTYIRTQFTKSGSVYTWMGMDTSSSSAYLVISVVNNQTFVKIIEGSKEREIFSPTESEAPIMQILDNTLMSSDEHDAVEDKVSVEAVKSSDANSFKVQAAGSGPEEFVINLAYTDLTEKKHGSESQLVNRFASGLALMNQAFINSKMNMRVVMGEVKKVDYKAKSLIGTVNAMAGISGLPRSGRATVLAIGINDPDYGGYAQIGGKYTAIEGNYLSNPLLAHELGHVFGGIHNEWYNLKAGSNTIMIPSGSRELVYSNPYINWKDYPAGKIDYFNADNICDRVGSGCHLWLIPPEMGPSLAGEIIIDDKAAEKTGTWSSSAGLFPYKGNSVYSDQNGKLRWNPSLTTVNTYDVYAWWTFRDGRSRDVPYRIRQTSGSIATKKVNQQNPDLAGHWILLGRYSMGPGSYVEVSSENGQASGDAVRLVPVGTEQAPPSSSPEPAPTPMPTPTPTPAPTPAPTPTPAPAPTGSGCSVEVISPSQGTLAKYRYAGWSFKFSSKNKRSSRLELYLVKDGIEVDRISRVSSSSRRAKYFIPNRIDAGVYSLRVKASGRGGVCTSETAAVFTVK